MMVAHRHHQELRVIEHQDHRRIHPNYPSPFASLALLATQRARPLLVQAPLLL